MDDKLANKILVLGKGAREHAISWKLIQSEKVSQVYVCPGNGGTHEKQIGITNLELDPNNFEELISWIQKENISAVIVGPEAFLEKGIADALQKVNILCFGPSSLAAQIETDKKWSKSFMQQYNIPTAKWNYFTNATEAKEFIKRAPYRVVVKASGLADGKGVFVNETTEDACSAVDMVMNDNFGPAGKTIVVEELLHGEEVSVLAFSDGETIKIMPPSQDHKRLKNNDLGPNTGGMGAYCPYPLSKNEVTYIENEILRKTIDGLKKESRPFIGVLYAGLMITENGIKVLEFNCRFGDPETQVILPLLETDLYDIIISCCKGILYQCEIKWKTNKAAVGVVIASEGYPAKPIQDKEITGIPKLWPTDFFIFHAGTKQIDDKLYTSGGRVITIVAIDDCILKATLRAIRFCSQIQFSKKQFRTDIGYKGIIRSVLKKGEGTYQKAGVDISAGNDFIKNAKALIESTFSESNITPIGSFAAIVDPNFKNYQDPVLVTGCDGVGTKLKIAQECNINNTIGQDLVAMCVNDILAQGAKPLFFLDYIASGKLEQNFATEVISGIVNGCKLAGCSLVGGETAEMPGFYANGEYDVAGFAVGIVERHLMLPKQINIGDKLIYLPSSGFHSNGFSLIRKIMENRGYSYQDEAHFSQKHDTFATEFLKPTTIYVKQILPLVEKQLIKAFVHITGGGIMENVVRVIPSNLKVILDALKWEIPESFGWISLIGDINEQEMLRTLNCGVGGIVIVDEIHANEVSHYLSSSPIGEVVERKSVEDSQIEVKNITRALSTKMIPYLKLVAEPEIALYKRVAVFISGRGSNLKSIIEMINNDPYCQAKIVVVVSSKENAGGINIAKQYNIPTEIAKRSRNLSIEENEIPLNDILLKYDVEVICLAGYMHILSGNFVSQWRGKMLNIHPSLLPSFKGKDAQAQALEAGVKITGCTVHFVEPEVDAGAIIDQSFVYVQKNDTVQSLSDRILEQEHKLYPRALKLVTTEKIKLNLASGKIIRR